MLGLSTLNQDKICVTKTPLLILWLCISTVLCVHGAVTYWQTAVLYPANPKSLFYRFAHNKKLPTDEAVKSTYNYQGFHLGHFVLNTLKKVNRTPSNAIATELNMAFRVYDAKNSPLVLDVAMLHGMQFFQGSDNKKRNLRENIAHAILQKAPRRSDLLVPYIKELIENQQADTAKDFIKTMLARNAKDPFALWLKGIEHIHEKDTAYGKSLMIQALDQGIEKWIYIPRQLKDQIKEKPLF